MIPRFSIQGTGIYADSYEAEGCVIQIRWFGFVFEVTVARIVRRFDA